MRLYQGPSILLCALLQLQWQPALVLPLALTSPRIDMNFTELVKFDGYRSEWHHVTTSDGYILSVFRVRTEACSGTSVKELVLFAHGMYLSGDDCVTPGPRAAICYLLADTCRDVWVFNARGSRYSRAHTTLNPNTDAQYWNFAFDEMALYDLPTTIDYILGQTGQKQIVFIGHSQGAAILMILCAKKAEYNDKIKIGFGLSPTVLMSHSRFVVVKAEEVLSPLLRWMDRTDSHFELFSYGSLSQKVARLLCGRYRLSYPFCSALIFSLIGYNSYHITPKVLPVMFGHLPSGTSVKNFLRWGQIVRNGFTEYDFGEEENLIRYGVEKPPMFDLSVVTRKWVLIGSSNDYIADLKDVEITASALPNAWMCALSDKTVGHLDFIFGTTVVKYIVPIILTSLDENKFICL